MQVPEVRYVRNGGVALAYQVFGEGPIDVVYLQAFVSNIEIAWESPHYARFLRRLGSFSRVIFMDRRGTGLSDRMSPTDLPPLETLMDDLRVVLDAAGSNQPALFAYSDVACLCALFAGTFPDRVSAQILFAVAAAGIASAEYPWQWNAEEWDAYYMGLAAGWGTRAYAEEVVPWFHPSLAEDERHTNWWARFMRQSASPNAAEAIERLWQLIDIRPILPTISVPTLVMHRVDDQVERVEAGRDVASRIPGARFVELMGGDDSPWAGDQDRVLDEIERFLTGTRHIADVDRVLATVLFTDIVGSTAKAVEVGDEQWSEVLSRHDELVRAELERFRGREVDTTGDGFLATFDGPARAVRCAQAIAESIRDLGIAVRAGVHTGEVELDRDEIRGIAVHVGARIGALANANEVLVSSTVKDLVAGSGLRFEDAGNHELKGIPDRWRLFRVIE
jgi:class 3 adenylate cyclase